MDEYIGIPRDHPESYWTFMHENFFNHIDIKKENINILDGNTNNHELECQHYEEKVGYVYELVIETKSKAFVVVDTELWKGESFCGRSWTRWTHCFQ